jgi:hypothetical protein
MNIEDSRGVIAGKEGALSLGIRAPESSLRRAAAVVRLVESGLR